MTNKAIADITAERERQHTIGYDNAHDDEHGVLHLLEWASRYARRAAEGIGTPAGRADLVKCAALVVAAIEATDRNTP
ncbi:hypothetical protein SEA_FAITH5X5_55 [Gordonia phage Faith5x5]|nr:hypothetical protein SEA_FAITH5X5_55 [Gordonia phage Faith5x5]